MDPHPHKARFFHAPSHLAGTRALEVLRLVATPQQQAPPKTPSEKKGALFSLHPKTVLKKTTGPLFVSGKFRPVPWVPPGPARTADRGPPGPRRLGPGHGRLVVHLVGHAVLAAAAGGLLATNGRGGQRRGPRAAAGFFFSGKPKGGSGAGPRNF